MQSFFRSLVAIASLIVASSIGLASAENFHPNKSKTFENTEQLFKVEYLDDASLTGFVAIDQVQLGDYFVKTRFGCVTKSQGRDWNEADGILGMGFPAAALKSVPFPLFWSLTDMTKAGSADDHVLDKRVFTVLLTSEQGELVLGGYDPHSVKGEVVTTLVRPSMVAPGVEAFMHYMIDVQSLKLGDKELLNFKEKDIGIQAILDSGTSCLVIPDDDFDGGLDGSPFAIFEKEFPDLDDPSLFITIAGRTFELPADDFVVNGRTCVMKMANTPRTFLLGDVFFRRMVVIHNLTDVANPTVSLGERNRDYPLASQPTMLLQTSAENEEELERVHRVPLKSKAGGALRSGDTSVSAVNLRSAAKGENGRKLLSVGQQPERVPLSSSNSYIYYAQLSVGTPRQKDIHVILDTGSSVFAIFAVPHGGPSALVIFLLIAALVLGLAAVGLMILSWYQSREEECEYEPVPDYGSRQRAVV